MVIILVFLSIVLIILAILIVPRFSKEDYTFLTVDEASGDLAIVDGGGDLTVDEASGTLKSAGDFLVGGSLTASNGISSGGDISASGKQITSGSLNTGSIKANGDIDATGRVITSGSLNTGSITAAGDITASGKKITSGSVTTGSISCPTEAAVDATGFMEWDRESQNMGGSETISCPAGHSITELSAGKEGTYIKITGKCTKFFNTA